LGDEKKSHDTKYEKGLRKRATEMYGEGGEGVLPKSNHQERRVRGCPM